MLPKSYSIARSGNSRHSLDSFTFEANQIADAPALAYHPANGLPAALTQLDSGLGVSYEYDIMDRQTDIHWTDAATNGTPIESYQYDPAGNRIATTTDGETTWHVHDGAHVIADVNEQGELLRTYTWGPGIDNLLALTVHDGESSETFYAVTDHLGTVHSLVDENGNIAESYKYDAFGNVLGIFDGSGTPITHQQSTIQNRYLFQGREYSFASGLYNFRARWYDPLTGRWLSNDPIGISGGLNQYVAFGNNPVMFVDPWGKEAYLGLGLRNQRRSKYPVFLHAIMPAHTAPAGPVITGSLQGDLEYSRRVAGLRGLVGTTGAVGYQAHNIAAASYVAAKPFLIIWKLTPEWWEVAYEFPNSSYYLFTAITSGYVYYKRWQLDPGTPSIVDVLNKIYSYRDEILSVQADDLIERQDTCK